MPRDPPRRPHQFSSAASSKYSRNVADNKPKASLIRLAFVRSIDQGYWIWGYWIWLVAWALQFAVVIEPTGNSVSGK